MKAPQGHDLVETEDGSYTLFSHQFQECCHSQSGAIEETQKIYIEGTRLLARFSEYRPFIILEVGLGLGINFQETLKCLKPENKLLYFSLEIDVHLVNWVLENIVPKNFKISRSETYVHGHHENCEFYFILGDARQRIDLLASLLRDQQVHSIYQDAFSPKKNEMLWTISWFEALKNISAKDVILTTYSSSTRARKSLHQAGWILEDLEGFAQKKRATRALLYGKTSEDILAKLLRSPLPAFTD